MSAAGRTVEVACTIEIERSARWFHAHAVPQGIDIRPGDVVTVHGAPGLVPFGSQMRIEGRATVVRAGWIARHWTRLAGVFALAELFEVGFQPGGTR